MILRPVGERSRLSDGSARPRPRIQRTGAPPGLRPATNGKELLRVDRCCTDPRAIPPGQKFRYDKRVPSEEILIMFSGIAMDRRRNTRVSILGKLRGREVTLDVTVKVTEISLGGMGIETDIPLSVDAVHTFQVTLADNSVVHLKGQVKHCHPLSDDPERFLSGIQFIDDKAND